MARIAAVHTGSRLDRFLTLANIYRLEEAASTIMGGANITMFADSRADALAMAKHMSVWVYGGS